MSNTKVLKPAEGASVRHPDGMPLAADGEAVTVTPYWQRRIADGDVVEVKPETTDPVATEKVAGNGRESKGKRE